MARTLSAQAKYIIYCFSSSVFVLILIISNSTLHEYFLPYEISVPAQWITYQTKLNELLVPDKVDHEFAINQLKKMIAHERIMKSNGWTITKSDLEKEAQRIQSDSRNLALLEKVKQIQPSQFYLDVFVKNTLIQRTIYSDFYFSNSQIHKKSKEQAEALMEALKNVPINLINKFPVAKEIEIFELRFDPSKGILRKHKNNLSENEKINSKLISLDSEWQVYLQPGSWQNKATNQTDQLIFLKDDIESYSVVWLHPNILEPNLSVKGVGYSYRIPKRSFNDWIVNEEKKYRLVN